MTYYGGMYFRAPEPRAVGPSKPNPHAKVEALEHQVERLLMISEALWGVLRDQHGFDDNELIRRITEIDLQDGVLDGRVKKSEPQECKNCTRKLSRRHVRCIYCGELNAKDPFER